MNNTFSFRSKQLSCNNTSRLKQSFLQSAVEKRNVFQNASLDSADEQITALGRSQLCFGYTKTAGRLMLTHSAGIFFHAKRSKNL